MAEQNEDIYSEEGLEELEENDEISPEEAGFMEGEKDGGRLAKDALTGEPILDHHDIVERIIDGKLYRFISEENAEKFVQNNK
jgi:hypothetical protein